MKTKDGRFFLTLICFVGGLYLIVLTMYYWWQWCSIRFPYQMMLVSFNSSMIGTTSRTEAAYPSGALEVNSCFFFFFLEMFEDTKRLFRRRKSKMDRQYNGQKKINRQYNGQKKINRQYNGQKKNNKRTNDDLQNTTKTRNNKRFRNTSPTKTLGELWCSGRVISSCTTSCYC